jgi:hypothetical protein
METIRSSTSAAHGNAYSLIGAVIRTHQAVAVAAKRDSPTLDASRPRKLSPEKNESPSASSTLVVSTPSPRNAEAMSSTDSCQPLKTNDSTSVSPHLQKRKQLYNSRTTSLRTYFDTAGTKFSAGKLPDDKRWAIRHLEPTTQWTSESFTTWLQFVMYAVHEQAPDDFAWTQTLCARVRLKRRTVSAPRCIISSYPAIGHKSLT